ncbi:hypothetical protein ScPMuIL_002699 [Solemya velum]
MAATMFSCGILSLFFLFYFTFAELPKTRFEYKFSFKGPHLVQKDRSIPFWEYGGDAIASDENIRITPSLRSKRGWVWTKNIAHAEHWSIEVVVRISGRGRVGADGMAIWFTEARGDDGTVFGGKDQWKGLGVFLDSFDNDGQHNNPYLMAMVNDGTKSYDHQSDGLTQQAGGCLRDFRNKPFPVRIKVEYYNKVLTVFFNNGLTNDNNAFELCLRSENVELPKTGYFGVSAATGGLADDQDVLAFLTHSLFPPGQQPADSQQVSDDQKKKFEMEFDEYYKELEKQKQDYRQQHPDKMGGGHMPEMFEGQGDREVRMIFEGQTMIHETMRELSRKLDELLGRQEMTLSRVNSLSGGQVHAPAQGGGQPVMVDSIKRFEVEQLLNNQKDIMQGSRDVRIVMNDIQQKANYIQGQVGQGGQPAAGGGGNMNLQLVVHELQDNLKTIRRDVTTIIGRPAHVAGGASACPPPIDVSCVSPLLFFVGIIGNVIFLIAYFVYRQKQEDKAKKFY